KTRVASIDNNQLVKGTLVFVDNVSYSGNNPKVRQINEEGFYYYNGDIWTRSAGPAGANGKTILSGNSNPTNQGTDGDFYINTTANTLFGPKTGSNWGSGKSLIGPKGDKGDKGDRGTNGTNGKTILSGTSNPTNQGTDGDFYINTTTNTLFGPKTGSNWGSGKSLVGPKGDRGTNGTNGKTILSGNSNPTNQGTDGDFYINTTTNTLFGPKTGSNWGSGKSLIGPKGANGNNGASMLTGNGVPQAATGTNGDSYVDTATGTVYKKNNGSWANIGSIKGATGQQGPQGVAGPKGATGQQGPQGPAGPQGGIGLIGNGTNTTVTGNGTTANPYKINTSTGNITGTGITVGNGNGAALKGVTLSIADNAINSAKIQNETIESVDIKNGAIKGEDIANATITADKLAANVLQNIYTHDGTITQNRKVTTGNNALTIEGTAYHPLQISTHNSNGNGGLSIRPKGDNDKRIEFNATPEGNLRLWAARDVIYALRSNGNVGIGTNSPVDKLQVAGNVLSIGALRSSVNAADGVGGYVELINDAKTGAVLSKRWRIYNMQSKGTNKYADGLHFWGYAEDGTNLGPKAILTDDGKLNIGFGSSVSSNASATQKLNVKGNVLISDLAGAGDRIVLADANGILKTGSVSASTLSGTVNITGTGITVGNGNGAALKNVTLRMLMVSLKPEVYLPLPSVVQ
ncbi:MAG: hypothetical protein SPI78_01220, partial [Bergeyella zoohelcum]|nr:hypothetical protein [Bergeyella zoohelcum]